MSAYISAAIVFLIGGVRVGTFVFAFFKANKAERREFLRPMILRLSSTAPIMLIGVMVLPASNKRPISPLILYLFLAWAVGDAGLRWRWRKTFPKDDPGAIRRRFILTRGAGIALLLVQGALLLRDRGLARETPIWPAAFGLVFLVAALIYYVQSRSV